MRTCAALLVLTVLLVAPSSQAQTAASATASTAAAVWEVQLDVQKLFASPVGQTIMELVKQKEPAAEQKLAEFSQAVGIDLRTAIGAVRIYGNSFEDLENTKNPDISAVVSLGDSRGNIEGWILAAPGYQSEELDDSTLLHSFKIEEGDHRLWCALPRNKTDNRYKLVASFNRDNALKLAAEAANSTLHAMSSPLAGDTLLTVRINELSSAPIELDEDDPGAGLVKAVRSVAVDVASTPEQVSARCTIEADSPARAEQVHQLIVGLKAMFALAAPKDDADAQKALEFLNRLTLNYTSGDTRISTEASIDHQEFATFIKDNM